MKKKATTSDVGDLGEALVKRKLERLGFKVEHLKPRARHYDLIARKDGQAINVQVKSFRSKEPTLNPVTKFAKIDIIDERQYFKGLRPLIDAEAVWVWVYFAPDGSNSFYLTPEAEVQKIVCKIYSAFLDRANHKRPRNPYSLHLIVYLSELKRWQDRWSLFPGGHNRFAWDDQEDIRIVKP